VLLELQIENFALIEAVTLEFREGLNVLTGETGAGKSIVLDALGFLLGDAVRDSLFRAEARARVSGRFLLSPEVRAWLMEQGWDDEEEAVALREIGSGGRSLCRLNGRMCSLAQLRELGNQLLEIHSQHQSNTLLRPSRHLELLDRLAGPELQQQLEGYRKLYREWQEGEKELAELGQAERDRNRQLEWLRFEVQEIEEAALQPSEDEELENQIRRLAAGEELGRRCAQALEALDGEAGAGESLGQAQRQLSGLLRLDPAAETFLEQLTTTQSQLGELVHALHRYADSLQFEPGQLDALQSRAETLRGLKRKYGADIDTVLSYLEEARGKLAALENAEERLEALQKQQGALREQLAEVGEQLHGGRQQQARLLEREVQLQLQDLNLKEMRFAVDQKRTVMGPQGIDALEFYLAPNPGTAPRPLAKIASGGELSRIMLAIIGIFAKFEPLTTLIFDEIDAGLGGRAAEAVARKLRTLAQSRQVLCVTHLAVIAAAGDQHIRVSKQTDGHTTHLQLDRLMGKEREAEIARMLSGDAGASSSQKLARELLKR
jgi:DNA repair protein RecN (Recombination protein N)